MIFIAGCATQPSPNTYDPPGFFSGIFHGLFLPFEFMGSIFLEGVRIYAFPNSGFFYDFGYIIGLAILVAILNSKSQHPKER